MNSNDKFNSYIDFGKKIANSNNMQWHFNLDKNGKGIGWNLNEIVGGMKHKNRYLRDFGADALILKSLNIKNISGKKLVIDSDWQEFIKAAACVKLLYNSTSPGNVCDFIIRPLKTIATCALVNNVKPWDLTVDIVKQAVTHAKSIQACGKLADSIISVTEHIIDKNFISRLSPIFPYLNIERPLSKATDTRSKLAKQNHEILNDLYERKQQSKLPDQRAFWELVRIIFTENPKTFTDALLFSAIKIQIFTGFRVGEVALLPLDWKRTRSYYDKNGVPAGKLGGYSESLLIRHFAEKQSLAENISIELYENTQEVPKLFESALTEVIEYVARITEPLRDTLQYQCTENRLLPWFNRCDFVSATKIYPIISGNPFWLNIDSDKKELFIKSYRNGFDKSVLTELEDYQKNEYEKGNIKELSHSFYTFFHRLKDRLNFYDKSCQPLHRHRLNWKEAYINIGELEDFLGCHKKTKKPDTTPVKTTTGNLQPWEFLFLLPKRNLSENRNNGITNLLQFYSIGMPDPSFILVALGEKKDAKILSIFESYGQTEEDKSLRLTSQSLRHLQNTELFRLSVADTIISKRFNRRSIAQSHEYDHRSLAESLSQIELPDELETFLGENSTIVAKLIQIGKANGPVIDTFKKIQSEKGDQQAFEYLRVEADGFHATPYGHCINSFTVDPCPKNLECFNGCRHLSATNLSENRVNLENLARQFEVAISDIMSKPIGTLGRDNQLSHAIVRLENINKLLGTTENSLVFPDGVDLSRIKNNKIF